MQTGTTRLPLHNGHCPPWLFDQMKELAGAIMEAIRVEYSAVEMLRRLSDPYWFQAFGCVLGFDWHSSGLTTVVCGALKESLNVRSHELGLYIAGGKGGASRKTPQEIAAYAERLAPDLPVDSLQQNSRMAAKVDSAAVQDGYAIYHHTFVVTDQGQWAVIQQGMNGDSGWARRYHWLSDDVDRFVIEPHSAVCADDRKQPLNMVAEESEPARRVSTEIAVDKPVDVLLDYRRILDRWDSSKDELSLPSRHELPNVQSLERALAAIYDHPAEDFEQLLGTRGVGPKTVRALSMVAEIVWGARPSYRDPARYAFAHGGKDGHPYPVHRQRYSTSIQALRKALRGAKIGDLDKMKAFKRLAKLESQQENALAQKAETKEG